MSKPIDSRSVSKWTITLDEDRRPWQLVKRREEWANVDTGLRISVGGGESPTRDVILRATVAWDFDEADAVMNGTKVPGELYKQLDELLRADLVKGIPYELRGLVKPGQTGRELLKEERMSSKSKTREVDRIEKRLTSLVLTNKQDYIRFKTEWADIQTLISDLPESNNIDRISPEMLRSKFLKKVKFVFPSVNVLAR